MLQEYSSSIYGGIFMAFSLVCDLGNFCLPILKVIVSLRSMESPDEP